MYAKIKSIVKAVVPKKILFTCEPAFRFVLYQCYRGKGYQCNICRRKLRTFIHLKDDDNLCPYCGSLSRTRRLWELIQDFILKKDSVMLDFSPSRSLYRKLKKMKNIRYVGSDISGDFLADFHYDITHIDAEDDTFDVILCYHILEHVADDAQAMKELYRVLKKGGTCLVQTPFKEGETDEDPTITSDTERLKRFGQKDHVRVYSANGLAERLRKAGFQVAVKQLMGSVDDPFGFKAKEEVLFCRK